MSSQTLGQPLNNEDAEVDPKDFVSPTSKKLKQGRLMFKPVSQKTHSPLQSLTKDTKKRKLSDPESPLAKQPKSVRPPSQASGKQAHPENDNEVSSSSEAEVQASTSQLTCRKTLERFVCPVRKEEDITSTSEVIDLTDEPTVSCEEKQDQPVSCEEKQDQPVSCEEKENEVEKCEEAMDIDKDDCIIEAETTSAKAIDNITKIIEKVVSQSKCSPAEVVCDSLSNNINMAEKTETNTNSEDNNSGETCKGTEVKEELLKDDHQKFTKTEELHVVIDEESLEEEYEKVGSLDSSSSPGSPLTKHTTESGCDSDMSKTSDEGEDSVMELSSSFISPQTADDSFRKATSAGSTPRINKPRSKVSSAKKAEREALRQKRKEQKEKEMAEKKRLKEEARAEKEKIRKEEKEKKEKERQQKEKEKQARRDQQEKEKQEKLQQREEEKKKKQEIAEAKQEEKKKKDEEKKLQEEEKRLKEEEKLKEDEEKLNLKRKMQNKFQSFFTKSKATTVTRKVEDEQNCGRFMPFEIKKDMTLAPQNFYQIEEENKTNLDKMLYTQDCGCLYLDELKKHTRTPGRWQKDKNGDSELEVMELGQDADVIKKMTYHVKLLQFHKNYRPPYYGTWRKKSKVICARNPWKTDKDLLDYEVDSDDEWEEEEPGESISASEGEEEKDEDGGGDEDEDGWMVPDGYLSRDEGCDDDEEITPAMLKARQMAWEIQLKRKCQPQTAIISGCFWSSVETPSPDDNTLAQYKVVVCFEAGVPIVTSHVVVDKCRVESSSCDGLADTPSSRGSQKRPVPEEAMPDLIRLLHGNPSGMKRLVEEFRMYWSRKTSQCERTKSERCEESMEVESATALPETTDTSAVDQLHTPVKTDDDKDYSISKRQMEMRIASIAVREKRTQCKKVCWYVHNSILQQYGLEDLPIPSKWQYVSIPNKKDPVENLTNNKVPVMSPNVSSPLDVKTEAMKRPNDQRTITFFTKAKEAIMKSDSNCTVSRESSSVDNECLPTQTLSVKPSQPVLGENQTANQTINQPTPPKRIKLISLGPLQTENKVPSSQNKATSSPQSKLSVIPQNKNPSLSKYAITTKIKPPTVNNLPASPNPVSNPQNCEKSAPEVIVLD